MIKVNVKNGDTLTFDLTDSVQKGKWDALCTDYSFQQQITGMGIIYNSQLYTLPSPKKFSRRVYFAEIIKHRKNDEYVGERIICQVDDVQISVLVYFGKRPRMSRVDVIKIGRLRHSSLVKGKKNAEQNI